MASFSPIQCHYVGGDEIVVHIDDWHSFRIKKPSISTETLAEQLFNYHSDVITDAFLMEIGEAFYRIPVHMRLKAIGMYVHSLALSVIDQSGQL
jgi:hypothetical protein